MGGWGYEGLLLTSGGPVELHMGELSAYSGQPPIKVCEIESGQDSSCRLLTRMVSAFPQHPLLSLQGHAFPLELANIGLDLKAKSGWSPLGVQMSFYISCFSTERQHLVVKRAQILEVSRFELESGSTPTS